MRPSPNHLTFRVAVVTAVGLLAALGCGQAGPKTYSVKGKVKLAAGDVKQLAGSHVEAALAGDPKVRTSGEIRADGTFSLQSLHAGVILKGVREGHYQVRLILSDDDRRNQHALRAAVAPRFLQFQTSGLGFQVPASGEVSFEVTPR